MYWFTGIFLLAIVPAIFHIITTVKQLKKKEKKWMLEEMLLNQAGMVNIFILPLHFFNLEFAFSSFWGLGIASFLMVAFVVLIYFMTFTIPKRAEELLLTNYPEYKLI